MRTKTLLTILLVVLTVTAGCLGGGAGDDGDADGGSGDDVDIGGGDVAPAEDSGSSDDIQLSDQERLLRDAGSFTATWQFDGVDENGVRTDVSREFTVDLENERSMTRISSVRNGEADSGSSEQFFADGVVYTRSGPAESPSYFAYEQESSNTVMMALSLSQARSYAENDGMSFEGRETFDGVAVERYELTRAESAVVQAGSAMGVAAGDSDTEITDFRYTVLVDEDGLVRFESWAVEGVTTDGEQISFEWEYSLTDVGSTTVDDPEWLAEAEAAAAAQSQY